MAGKVPYSLANPKGTFTYNPLHSDDLAKSVEAAFSKFGEVKGHKYTLNGSKEFRLQEIY